eukprot:ANDGO_01821.mRNA.1 putative pyridoxal 5'-phosphate synthase subunit PDX2
MSGSAGAIVIGVLSLQGAFAEHVEHLRRLAATTCPWLSVAEVRTSAELEKCDGLIIPGGESTSMALIAEPDGLFAQLSRFANELKRPVWGTCAGCILLSDKVDHQKNGGQGLIGGLHVETARNYFGRQIQSFETDLEVHGIGKMRAIFIRAPAILRTLGDDVEVLARYGDVIVAVRQGNKLGCVFHPELCETDSRFHSLFVDIVHKDKLSR